MKSQRDGFTLIELMIVVVIIGILSAIAIPKFAQVTKKAKESESGPIMKEILTLEERYRAKEGSYTGDLTLLEGGSELATNGKYFGYSATSNGSALCITAAPSTLGTQAGLTAKSLDATGNIRDSADCS